MSIRRRNFLLGGIGALFGANKVDAKGALNAAVATGSPYGAGVRKQVFEVIVRQALAGAPWKEICSGPMQVNSISESEVETEVARREHTLKAHPVDDAERARFYESCPFCNDAIAEQLRADHPNHKLPNGSWYCMDCRDERRTFADERRAFHAEHAEYSPGCEDCWDEFRACTRAHPKFGMLRPKGES